VALRREVAEFNASHALFKREWPLCRCVRHFLYQELMNQARALVHVYTDGSVSRDDGRRGDGAGGEYKNDQVAATVFSIDPAWSRYKNQHI